MGQGRRPLALSAALVRLEAAIAAPGGSAPAVVLAYGWMLHVPLPYFRMAYFLPLALVPLVAVAITRVLDTRGAV